MAKVYDNATDIITFARLQSQNTTSGSSYLGSDGLLKFAAEDEPRIEYAADGSLKGLLIEEQRTNLVPHSEDFSQWTQVLNVDLDTDGTIAPDGSLATRVTDNSTNGQHRCFQANVSAVPNNTFSVFLKAGTLQYVQLLVFDSVNSHNYYANFDVINQAVVKEQPPSGGTITANVAPVGNGWARYSIATSSANAANIQILCLDRALTGATPSYSGSGDTLYIWGAQVEEGSFPTSYIPTSGSTVTRSPDLASIPVSSFGYNQSAGTVVVEASRLAAISGDYNSILSIGTDSSNRIDLGTLNDDGYQTIAFAGPEVVTYNNGQPHNRNVYAAGVYSTAGLAFKLNSTNAAVNGTIAAEDTSCTIPTATHVKIGDDFSTRYLNGHIKSLQYYPRRLTDAQLQELTA